MTGQGLDGRCGGARGLTRLMKSKYPDTDGCMQHAASRMRALVGWGCFDQMGCQGGRGQRPLITASSRGAMARSQVQGQVIMCRKALRARTATSSMECRMAPLGVSVVCRFLLGFPGRGADERGRCRARFSSLALAISTCYYVRCSGFRSCTSKSVCCSAVIIPVSRTCNNKQNLYE